ncbi:hypothetical protein STEG23_001383 [Scotinomys teguina]
MQNDTGEFVDLYVLRKCSARNRIIGAKDHAAIQMNVAEVDRVTGRFHLVNLSIGWNLPSIPSVAFCKAGFVDRLGLFMVSQILGRFVLRPFWIWCFP